MCDNFFVIQVFLWLIFCQTQKNNAILLVSLMVYYISTEVRKIDLPKNGGMIMKRRFVISYFQTMFLFIQLLAFIFNPADIGVLILLFQAIMSSIQVLFEIDFTKLEFKLYNSDSAVDSWMLLTSMITLIMSSIAVCCNLSPVDNLGITTRALCIAAISIYFAATLVQAIVFFFSIRKSGST